MKIGKASVPRSAICTSNEHQIGVRGKDPCQDLIGFVQIAEAGEAAIPARPFEYTGELPAGFKETSK